MKQGRVGRDGAGKWDVTTRAKDNGLIIYTFDSIDCNWIKN